MTHRTAAGTVVLGLTFFTMMAVLPAGGQVRLPAPIRGPTSPAKPLPAKDPVHAAAKGARFVLLIDRSASMGEALDRAQGQAKEAVEKLAPADLFAVLFLDEGRPTELALDGKIGFHLATDQHKEAAKAWIGKQTGQSGADRTDPKLALERAFGIEAGAARTVVLFTDGQFPKETRLLARRLNADKKATIHVCCFGDPGADSPVRQMAEESNGEFTLVEPDETVATSQPEGPTAASRPDGPSVSLFRLDDKATAVVFVLDKSGSMTEGFEALQEEVGRAIDALVPEQKFQVIFFADGPPAEFRPGVGRGSLLPASDANKKACKEWIRTQKAGSNAGMTDPDKSMALALKVGGVRPDVIYLLTDGIFPPQVLGTIRKGNPGPRTRINAILFRDRMPEGEALLQKIAKENNGRYLFVDPSQIVKPAPKK